MKRILLFVILILTLPILHSNNLNAYSNEEPCMDCHTSPLLFCPSTYFGCPGDNLDPSLTGTPVALPGDMNCPTPEVSYTDTLITDTPCFKKYHRIWRADYPEGTADPKLFAQCIQTIFLEDNEDPVISDCPSDISIDLLAQCDSTAFWTIPTVTDNCAGVSLDSNFAPGDTFPSGSTTVLYIAEDACGRLDSCSFNVIVSGVCCENVVLSCPPDTSVCVNATLDPLLTGFATFSMPDSTCTDAFIFYSDSLLMNNPDCSAGVILERTWYASDSNQISIYDSCVQIITSFDTIAPEIQNIPQDITVVGLGSNCTAIANWTEPIAVDSCGVEAFSSNISSGSSFPEGVSTISYAAVDYCGNTAVASFTVTVECDTSCISVPVITCPSDMTICPQDSLPDPLVTGFATAIPGDSLCAAPIVSYSDSIIQMGNCANAMIIERQWIAEDPDNNILADTCYQYITLEDTSPPVINNAPQDITITVNAANCLIPASWIEPDATDNCGLQSFTSNIPSGSLFSEGVTTVVYTAIDNCGLISTISFTITIDCLASCGIAPIINCPSDYWACPGGGIPTPYESGYALATAGSPECGDPLVTYSDIIVSSGPCATSKVIERTWTATDPDDPSLTTSCIQTLSLEDLQDPFILYCPSNITVYGSGNNCSVPVTWNSPLAIDNCGAPYLSAQDEYGNPVNNGQLFYAGTTGVIYTATDDCGNTSSCSFNVTVQCNNFCNTPPSINCPSNKVVCPGSSISPSSLGWANAIAGNYCPTPSVSYTDIVLSTGPCFGEKVISRTWVADYGASNNLSSSCVQTIQLKDDTAPVFTYCPADITVYDSATPVYWNTPVATDNCGIANVLSSHNPGSYFSIGTTTVYYTAEDICWNASTCSFNVTVQNQYNITLDCPDDLLLSCNGNNGVVAQWSPPSYNSICNNCNDGYPISGFVYMGSLNGSLYYCSTGTASWPQAKATCEANGGHLVSINSQEENDFLANILTLQSAWIGLSDSELEGNFKWTNGDPLAYTNWYPGQPNNYNNNQDYVELMNTGFWNDQYNYYNLEYIMEIPCGSVQQVAGPSPGSILTSGNYTVSYEVADGCGGFGSCSFDIYVEGGLDLVCPDDITITVPQGSQGLPASWNDPISSSCCNNCNDGSSNVYQGFSYLGSYNGHDYYHSNYATSWLQAKAACEQVGADLVVINSQEENDQVSNWLNTQSAWIGLSDHVLEGSFEWVNGDPITYTNWYPGQPNNYNNNQDYVEIMNSGEWNDQYNYYSLYFIMEVPNCINLQQISGPQKGDLLVAGNQYTVEYMATDLCGNSETCSFTITAEADNTTKDYCESQGLNALDYFITRVRFGQLDNISASDNGYADYTSIGCATIEPNQSYALYLTPSANQQDRIYWRVWIDYNLDGDFYDANEMVAYGSGITTVSGIISMPTLLYGGESRMRVIMSPVDYPSDPCGDYSLGETEDYCVLITNVDTSNLGEKDLELVNRNRNTDTNATLLTVESSLDQSIDLFPNPASDMITMRIEHTDILEAITLNDAVGRTIKIWSKNEITGEIRYNIANLESGIYFVQFHDKQGKSNIKKLIVSR